MCSVESNSGSTYGVSTLCPSSVEDRESIDGLIVMQSTNSYENRNGSEGLKDYAILPRRKAGQTPPAGERAPVLLTNEVLSKYFCMPLSAAAKELVRNVFWPNLNSGPSSLSYH
jgi:hypothetical protein